MGLPGFPQAVGMGLPGFPQAVGIGGTGAVVPGFFGFGFATFFAIPVSFNPAGARRRACSALETRAVDRGG
jgi:hypothetical protein